MLQLSHFTRYPFLDFSTRPLVTVEGVVDQNTGTRVVYCSGKFRVAPLSSTRSCEWRPLFGVVNWRPSGFALTRSWTAGLFNQWFVLRGARPGRIA